MVVMVEVLVVRLGTKYKPRVGASASMMDQGRGFLEPKDCKCRFPRRSGTSIAGSLFGASSPISPGHVSPNASKLSRAEGVGLKDYFWQLPDEPISEPAWTNARFQSFLERLKRSALTNALVGRMRA